MQSTSSSNIIGNIPPILNSTIGLIAIALSGLSGGFFAGFFTNHFESKRRIREKRNDKYFEHRNTIVQVEQELIPLRINLFRNLYSLKDVLENTNEQNIRFILRFYNLNFSTGLGLKLLDLDFINKYAILYSSIETLNSDMEYISSMVAAVRENAKLNKTDDSLVSSYVQMISYLKEECEDVDAKSLEFLSLSKLAIDKNDEKVKLKYIKDGKAIKYSIKKDVLRRKNDDIKKEEDPSSHKGEKQPKFFAPFLDLKRVLVSLNRV